ncbi:hypothetical protein POM88_013678 [Heracleum sosnowskyi]|uniref:Uncharacterized protein n=1 Tax=Heracleum sosnowskyi TaxID=360622 RepID=A0AAD8N3H9_9APIA|nr:hypothetical protein POM88_013678 [Heracleum sosnowskyi]
MADALDCGMRTLHAMHLRDPPDWFYDIIPDFLARYDRINNEWRGHAYTRPSFDRPSRDFDPDASSSQQPLAISQKRPREIETTDSPTSPTHDVSYKRPRQVESTDDPVIQQNPVVDPPLVHVEVGDSAPSPSQQDSERSPPPVVEVTTIPPVTQPSPTTPVATIPPVTQPSPAPLSLTTPVTWWQCPTPPEVASTVGPVAAAVRLSRLLGMFSNEDQFKDMERRRHKPKAVKEIKDLAMHPSCRTPEEMVGLKRKVMKLLCPESVFEAKAIGVRKALSWIAEKEFKNVMVETDSSRAVCFCLK